MSNSHRIRLTLASAVLGLGAVTAAASTAGAATLSDDAQPAGSTAPATAGTQDTQLSDGSVAHVTDLGGGRYQAWVTHDGTRIASLSPGHDSARVNGSTFELNQANGFVGVKDSSGWHSESDIAKPDTNRQDGHRHTHQQTAHKHVTHKHAAKQQAVGATRDIALPNGAVAHVTRMSSSQWQAWITFKGVRIASLSNAHANGHVHGWTYHLNHSTGAVTVQKPAHK